MIFNLRDRTAKLVVELAGNDDLFTEECELRLDIYLEDRIDCDEEDDEAEKLLEHIEVEIRQTANKLAQADIEVLLREVVLGQSPAQAKYRAVFGDCD